MKKINSFCILSVVGISFLLTGCGGRLVVKDNWVDCVVPGQEELIPVSSVEICLDIQAKLGMAQDENVYSRLGLEKKPEPKRERLAEEVEISSLSQQQTESNVDQKNKKFVEEWKTYGCVDLGNGSTIVTRDEIECQEGLNQNRRIREKSQHFKLIIP